MVSIYPVFNQTVNQHLNSLIVPHPLQLYDSLLINIQYFLRTQLKILDLFKHNMPFAIFDTFDQLLILHVQSYFGFLLQLFKTVSKVVFLQKLQNQLDELVLFHLHLHSINYLRTRSLLNIGSGVVQLVSMLVCRTIDPGSNPGAGVIFMLSSIYCYTIIYIFLCYHLYILLFYHQHPVNILLSSIFPFYYRPIIQQQTYILLGSQIRLSNSYDTSTAY